MRETYVDETERRREERKFRRFRTLGTNNPFCRICGKNKWFVRYEYHHVGGRKYTNTTIFLCLDCHNEATEMDKDFPPLPPHIEESRASLIRVMRGHKVILKLALKQQNELIQWLLGDVDLPTSALAPKNDNASVGVTSKSEGYR
jgi:hypothetical protein